MTAVNENYYQLYIDAVLELAQTIVVKSQATVDGLNDYVTTALSGTVDTSDPTTWKYYLNIAGEYHPTDTVMSVTSLDTLQPMDFTKANLAINTATARGYEYGTRNYLELVSQYPDQEMLILGILYPVDQATAIAADDGKILGYPPGLVESNEYTFQSRLQQYITGFMSRWVNQVFAYSDDLYPAAALGMMYMLMVPAIISIRLEMSRTNEAHSFHVRQYLASNGNLDEFYDYLSLEQSLFFYRNINYIQRHAGMQSTFDVLVENLMTARNLPIAEYAMVHDTTNIATALAPNVIFQRTPLNLGANVDAKDTITVQEMLDKENGLARSNALYETDYVTNITEVMENSLSNKLPTKVLESSMVDYSDSAPVTLSDTLLYNWLWLSYKGIYTAYVSITNPVTGETISLTAADAYCFAVYCFAQSVGVVMTAIPPILAARVIRTPLPTVTEMMSIVDNTLVDPAYAQLALSSMPAVPSTIVSTDAFYSFGEELFTASTYQRRIYATQEHKDARAMVFNMIDFMYCDAYCALAESGSQYADWLNARNIHTDSWTIAQYGQAYTDLVSYATGAAQNTTVSLAQLQAAMVGMFAQLSSYSIQFLASINASNVRMSDDPYVRLGDANISATAEYGDTEETADVVDVQISALQEESFEISDFSEGDITIGARIAEKLDVVPSITMDPNGLIFYVNANMIEVRAHPYPKLEPNALHLDPVLGMDLFLGLTAEQQTQFQDVYNPLYSAKRSQSLARIVSTTYLNGIVWVQREELTQLIGTPLLSGLVWRGPKNTVSLESNVSHTDLDGLVWTPGTVPVKSFVPRWKLTGLSYVASTTNSLANSLLISTLNGLKYRPSAVPITTAVRYKQMNGLTWVPGTFSMPASILQPILSGLRYHPATVPLHYAAIYKLMNGLTYVSPPASLTSAIPRPTESGLTFNRAPVSLASVVIAPRLDGILWPTEPRAGT